MRPIRALVVWLLLLLSAAAGWGGTPPDQAAPTVPTFGQAKSWRITYRYVVPTGSEPTDGTLVVSFLAPDRMKARSTASYLFSAVADHDSIRVFFPELNVAMWTPAGYSFALPQIGLTMGGTDGPLGDTDWKAIGEALQHGGQLGDMKYELLPEEEIAGRKCLVLRTTVATNQAKGPKGGWETTQWFDKEYGLPLAMRSGRDGQRTETRAKSVSFDGAASPSEFEFRAPRGVPLLRGPLACCDVVMAGEMLTNEGGGEESPQGPPEVEGASTVLQPGRVPAGFRSTGCPSTAYQPGAEARQWAYTLVWFNPGSGGAIKFTQGVGEVEEQSSRMTGERQPISVRGKVGEMLSYHVPFDGLALTWQDGPQWFLLEGTGVAAKELLKMAEVMNEVKVAPAPKTRATPPSSRRSTPGAQ